MQHHEFVIIEATSKAVAKTPNSPYATKELANAALAEWKEITQGNGRLYLVKARRKTA